ncbi:RagB/SusD family nutrient uptake outer membrane protein [uncultured Bacteroides sp.]|jgi:hypothetical protein|uniref:RagB/SusD family nutrient uptake outer membrane protein n=1 Tax=uncultured Bacteroides sp. TaxID=162156 RepID=UPI000820CC01|nr:RagB/SusD family nutrient uptake outer membrane protein [uncultured Bacteroides sp.]SCG93169.1 SusD family [uncultured Bacteroides sp.]
MKKNNLYYILCLLLCGLTNSACLDTLTEDPNSYYEKKDFFTDKSKAQMAVVGVYSVLPTLYGDYEMALPCSDDTYYASGTNSDNTRRDIAHYTLNPANQYVYNAWKGLYQGINYANYAIQGIEGMENYEGDTDLQAMVAEAKFLRALYAFSLVRYWGDVPFKTTYSDSYEHTYQPRSSRETIYDQIINDLNFAKGHLAWADASSSPEKASQGSARALLMRVLLQRAGYSLQMDGTITRPDESKRQEYFNAVIREWEEFKTNGYHNFYTTGYLELFKGFSAGTLDSQESLFEVAFYSPDGSTGTKGYWGTYIGPAVAAPGIASTEANQFMGRANALFRVVPEWKEFFEAGDARRDVMVCTYKFNWDKTSYSHKKVENKSGKDWYPGKWRREWMPIGYKNPNVTDVNFCYIRYADVVLMAAEAFNETDNTPEAWKLLNSVRKRAGATEITSENYASLLKAPKVYNLNFINDGDEAGRFRTALYWERGFELAFEGQRKYDLIRWGIIQEALALFFENSAANTSTSTGYPAGKNFRKGKHELFPIPTDELQLNYLLENKNNPNY